mmetsp:Transcript_3265/g.7149  ORF Transcript_3265/g.7149 Transcript_3265/m.7149 type:complete len:84 (+) Transcript_3265:517-768(+)
MGSAIIQQVPPCYEYTGIKPHHNLARSISNHQHTLLPSCFWIAAALFPAACHATTPSCTPAPAADSAACPLHAASDPLQQAGG